MWAWRRQVWRIASSLASAGAAGFCIDCLVQHILLPMFDALREPIIKVRNPFAQGGRADVGWHGQGPSREVAEQAWGARGRAAT